MSMANFPSQPTEYATAQVRLFLESRCVEDPGQRVRSGELYAAYVAWLPTSTPRLHQTQFSLTLEELGFQRVRARTGVRFVGLRTLQ